MKLSYLKLYPLIIILVAIIIPYSCKKTNVDNNIIPPTPPVEVTASVAGRVVDLDNAPVSGASVAAGSSTAITDDNGQFTLKDIQLNKDAGFVKVTKAGHFTGSRTFLVNGNTTNNVKIKMIPKTVSGTIGSSSGGNVDVTGGAKINFTAGSFVNSDNNTGYSGDVSVAGYYLNPADSSLIESKPGDLRGISIANKAGILKSFGMLSVEMNDAGGQKLKLAAGKTAAITVPIPSTLQADAPTTVPLWYFDETKGIWKEEGTATKQGNSYTGTVTHFSFWSTGQLAESVKLTATFKDTATGNVLVNKMVWISSPLNGTASGYTDNAGTVSGFIPANDALTMQVSDDYCGILIYKMHIGPFSKDVDLGIITVKDYGNPVHIVMSGTAVGCDNLPIERGFAVITSSYNYNQFQSTISNGAFIVPVNICKDLPVAATVWVYDSVNSQASNEYPITINSTNQNIGQIQINGCVIAPVAGFSYSFGTNMPFGWVGFNNTSTNATSYLWEFGDGTSSTTIHPAHTYATAGDFSVSLTAYGPGGSDTISKVINISVAPPVAGFAYTVGNTTLPVTVAFTDFSTNTTSWLWNFGDGASSSIQNPTHLYTIAGDFPVSLRATGPAGSDSITAVIHISGTIDSSYINLTMNGTTYTWAFPDISAYHTDTLGVNRTSIDASSASSPYNHIGFEILNDNASPGNYNIYLSCTINGTSYPSTNAITTVTEYGLAGGNIIGTSSGQFLDASTNISFTLAYKVKRNR
jgi:PKD repeat protein